MERRDFCKMIAGAAAATAVPTTAEAGQAKQEAPEVSTEEAAKVAETPSFKSFDTLTEDYATFCATPAAQREFFELKDGQFVKNKLDEATWRPAEWGNPPKLPVPGGSLDGVPMTGPIAGLAGEGPYKPDWDSLQQYETPEWYQDAKFGIWAHWSPQCVPEYGDWYGRSMYIEGSDDYKNQLAHYGDPSKFGYKDLCAQWTLLNWQPEELIARYKKAGAKLFITLANHHDGFDAWNSKHHPWNSGAIGPHRDVVGGWAAAARAQGMKFGVTVHQARNWWWFQTSHGANKAGPMAGAPYDGRLTAADGKNTWWEGLDPQLLYGPKHPLNALPDISYVKNFYDRTRDLIDQHDPDLLYFDNTLFPLGWGGMNIAAYYYNRSLQTHGGKVEGILNVKGVPDNLAKAVVADYERGITSKIMPYVWQSETCIGDWHYDRKLYDKPGEYGGYLPPRDAIHWMVDAVSKNGIFILDIPGRPDGTIDSKEIAGLDGITSWMGTYSEAIYETRPWKVYGEGPNAVTAGSFQGKSVTKLGEKDIRFTRNKANTVVYTIVLGWPTAEFVVESLGSSAATKPGKITNVQLLGTDEKVKWKQTAAGLNVTLPERYKPPVDYAAALKVQFT
ncbi:MAG: alpha-L-fucosidase [Edaphobacter sp.]|uniref:alpha-L-fucosidase n=1 Tax=Edaphobacter sp. TaxID=1934404 RepID=UPI002981000B|nr:alpha-L-fucosidase [Edaphobacter sp.]MDW5265256.1 alpha-L-fucosidase [Edaphobacter sp.]